VKLGSSAFRTNIRVLVYKVKPKFFHLSAASWGWWVSVFDLVHRINPWWSYAAQGYTYLPETNLTAVQPPRNPTTAPSIISMRSQSIVSFLFWICHELVNGAEARTRHPHYSALAHTHAPAPTLPAYVRPCERSMTGRTGRRGVYWYRCCWALAHIGQVKSSFRKQAVYNDCMCP